MRTLYRIFTPLIEFSSLSFRMLRASKHVHQSPDGSGRLTIFDTASETVFRLQHNYAVPMMSDWNHKLIPWEVWFESKNRLSLTFMTHVWRVSFTFHQSAFARVEPSVYYKHCWERRPFVLCIEKIIRLLKSIFGFWRRFYSNYSNVWIYHINRLY